MESVPGGRLDACVAISQGITAQLKRQHIRPLADSVPDDEASIADLSKTTSRCFDTDTVRLLYIRAQVTRIDLKIDLALCEVIRRYRRLTRSATGAGYAPMGATFARKVSIEQVTKAIINCFGLPTVSANTALGSLKSNVWGGIGSKLTLALAESFQTIGVVG
ncbi:hypothetical protein LTS01_025871, partial [Friedmanniomyces endolithicus]